MGTNLLYFLYSWGYAIWFCKFYHSGSWLAIELFLIVTLLIWYYLSGYGANSLSQQSALLQ